MAFYLRKSYSFGPLRLNLSKSGLGVSGGVTGARVGIGPKGTYFHGGRHGIYYRKYGLGSDQKKTGSKTNQTNPDEEYFIDTGLTYGKAVKIKSKTAYVESEIPKNVPFVAALVYAGIAALIVSVFKFSGFFIPLALGCWILAVALKIRFGIHKKRLFKIAREIYDGLEEGRPYHKVLAVFTEADLQPALKNVLDFHFYKSVQGYFYRDPDYITVAELKQLERISSLSLETKTKVKAEAYADFLEEVLQDHIISPEELDRLNTLQKSLGLTDEDVRDEKIIINSILRMSEAMDEPLEKIDANIELGSSEVCYHQTEGRLLKSKIMNRYQRDNVVYKEIGYDVDLEGVVYITNKEILIVGEGSRGYSLNKILDITLSLEDNTVQIVLRDRKSPLIYSMPDIASFAGKLKQITEKE